MIRTGTYRDKNGQSVHVRRTATGYVVTHADGRVETFSGLNPITKAGRA